MSCVPNRGIGAGNYAYPSKFQDVYIQERNYVMHQKRLYEIGKSKKKKSVRKILKSEINNHNKWTEFVERGKQFQEINKFNAIKEENKKILSKIVDIQKKSQYQGQNGLNSQGPLGSSGVNKFYQKKQISKIGEENQKMAQRLIQQKPMINTNKYMQEYQQMDPVKMRWQKNLRQKKYLEIIHQIDPQMDKYKKNRSQSYQLEPIHKTISPSKTKVSKKNFSSLQKQQARTTVQTPENVFLQRKIKNLNIDINLDQKQDQKQNQKQNPMNYYDIKEIKSSKGMPQSQQGQRNQKFSMYMSQYSQDKGLQSQDSESNFEKTSVQLNSNQNKDNSKLNQSQNENNAQEISYIDNNINSNNQYQNNDQNKEQSNNQSQQEQQNIKDFKENESTNGQQK